MPKSAKQSKTSYQPGQIEEKWQKRWEESHAFVVGERPKKSKEYLLIEFPYPSGDGLHVGHIRSYTGFDALARYRRLKGKNVLFPIGWDAFGLPTENYAIKTGIHPRKATDQNIATFRRQMKSLGLSFDWSREIDTTDPKYYKWTQWIFLQLFKKGMAYQATIPINWCPSCKIGLANEEVVSGKCERCGTEVTRKMQKQWMLKITAYAERLLKDLETVDYLPKIKTQQANWIGRSEGAEIQFKIQNSKFKKILVATNNPSKVERIRKLLAKAAPGTIAVTPAEAELSVEDVEESNDLFENARRKARAYFGKTDLPILGTDTGLFLDGEKINPAQVKRNALYGRSEKTLTQKQIGQAILDFYKSIAEKHLEGVAGYWKDVFVLITSDGREYRNESRRNIVLTTKSHQKIDWHFPLRSLYRVKSTGKYPYDQTEAEELVELKPYSDALLELFDKFKIQNSKFKKKKFILLHGFLSNPKDVFLPWLKRELESQGHEVVIPALPNPDKPSEAEQVGYVLKNVQFDEQTVLFGYSLGAVVAMKVAEKLSKPIARLVLAGGFLKPKFRDKPRPFATTFTWEFDFDRISQNTGSIAVLNDINDSKVPLEAGRKLAESLEVPLQEVRPKGDHFQTKEEPVILDALLPSIKVFTTRPDTIYGATYLVVAPEHELIQNSIPDQVGDKIQNYGEVERYIEQAGKKSDLDRTDLAKEKTGVELKGVKAINPASGEEIPIWVADYVLMSYGTGAIMAVPAHDERDYEFAKKYHLPIRQVIAPYFAQNPGEKDAVRPDKKTVKRKTAYALVYNKKKKAFLCLDWEKYGWHSGIIGGVDEGESYEEAARREIHEETGYVNLRFVKNLGGEQHNHFFAAHKEENRYAFGQGLLFELVDEEREPVPKEHAKHHKVVWADADRMGNWLNLSSFRYMWESFVSNSNCYVGVGKLIQSGKYSGLDSKSAIPKIAKAFGQPAVQYKLRDWVFSRQHYWGEPIPIIHCPEHGAVPEKDLPVELPYVEKYQPTNTGESPLANVKDWVNTKCPVCHKPAKRETDTMPNWAGSSWYYLRYCDPRNEREFAELAKLRYWLPVDIYNGGMEHTTLHLLYSRFWHKFLFDQGLVPTPEPYQCRHSHGTVLAEDGRKMSKSFGNVINPDDLVKRYGADSLRMYEMFMGPFEDMIPWSTRGLIGVYRFLNRVYSVLSSIAERKSELEDVKGMSVAIHYVVKKVTADLEAFKFNTAVSALMEFFNKRDFTSKLNTEGRLEDNQADFEAIRKFLLILFPFAPHFSAELWESLFSSDISREQWPAYDEAKLKEATFELVVQVNGKIRAKLIAAKSINQSQAIELILKSPTVNEKIKVLIRQTKRIVFVRDRLINIVN